MVMNSDGSELNQLLTQAIKLLEQAIRDIEVDQ